MNREGITDHHFFGDAVYSQEELVAEMSAAFLCGQCGIENQTIQNSAAYLPILDKDAQRGQEAGNHRKSTGPEGC